MKTLKLSIVASALLLTFACSNQNKTANQSEEKPSDSDPTALAEPKKDAFDIDKIPTSTVELGVFPYVTAPDGYEYSSDKKERSFEEKYFFHNDSLVTKVSGKYFHATILKNAANTNEYEKTLVVKSYEDAIKKLGAVAIFDGYMPDKANKLIDKDQPVYFKDLRSDYSMNYKQYLLKTPQGNIWFELGTVANIYEVDFSVVQESR